MNCENCNQELKTHWCEECWVEWFAYNNPRVFDAAVWRAAEPPAAEPAPELAAEPAAELTELERLRKYSALSSAFSFAEKYAEAKDEKVDLEDYIGNVCSMIENEVAFENLQEWLQEMKDKDLYRPGESEDDSIEDPPAAEPEPGKHIKT